MVAHTEITNVAIVALGALLCGLVMTRIRQSPLIGYIFAGVLLGPSGLGLVTNREAISTLAEFGVLLLLFVVGIELDLRRFISVWRVALFTTLIQIGGSVGVALLLGNLLGWPIGLTVLIGFVIAISSTAVVIKTLENSGEMNSPTGRTTVGILIAQDMAVVPMILILGGMGSGSIETLDIIKVLFSIILLVALLWFLLKRQVRLPFSEMAAKDSNLTPLMGLVWCFGAAAVSGVLGLSAAYGAFLAGLVIGNSAHSARMAHSIHPIQTVLMMVFFLSIGLLLDLGFIWDNLGTVLLLLLLITVFKTILNIGALRLLGESWAHAFLAGVALAQIGEFSFLFAEIGLSNNLISQEDARLVIAVTVLSLIVSPFSLLLARRLHNVAEDGHRGPREILAAAWGREFSAISRSLKFLMARGK